MHSESFKLLSDQWYSGLAKEVVRWYCFHVKPFNLTACFIMKCDINCYDHTHQNGGPWIAVYNNVRALVLLFLHSMSVLIGEKSFICGRTVKFNRQSKTFACVLANGYHWQCTNKYTFTDIQ